MHSTDGSDLSNKAPSVQSSYACLKRLPEGPVWVALVSNPRPRTNRHLLLQQASHPERRHAGKKDPNGGQNASDPFPYPPFSLVILPSPQLHQKQARADEIKSNEAAARIQAMERGRVARHHAAAERAARAAAAAKAEAEARAKAELEESARRLAVAIEERDAARAAVKIQCATRQRRARDKAARRLRRQQQEEEERVVATRSVEATVRIQSVARGWLVRVAGERAANAATLDAAIAARQARIAAQEAAQDVDGAVEGGVGKGRAGWRKKSVVGARGTEGMAGLQVQIPTSTCDT